MRALRSRDSRAVVQSHQVNGFQSLAEQLRVFIEKHDYKKAASFGEESDAWLRALDKFTGKMR